MGHADTQFALNSGEHILFETKWGSWLKSSIQVTAGRVVLTNQRLAFCDTGYTGFGLLLVIAQFFAPQTRLVWQVPVESIREVSKQRHGFASKYVVSCAGGQQYTIQVGTSDGKWRECLSAQGIKLAG